MLKPSSKSPCIWPNCHSLHGIRLHSRRQSQYPYHQSQAGRQVENMIQVYSQSGELRRALEKQFWEDLELILVQAPTDEEKNEKMSGDSKLDQVYSQIPLRSINQPTNRYKETF